MKDIIDSIKQQIKEKKGELAKLEAALGKLEGDKPAPKARVAKAATESSTSTTPGSAPAVTDGTLPDRIVGYLKEVDFASADVVASKLGAPIGQVRTTLSRMAREGQRIASKKDGRSSVYMALKSETPAANPFAEGAN